MLLSIRQLFQRLQVSPEMGPERWKRLFDSARFRQAVSQIFRLVKAERVGINMMDITVCGAVAPYNVLLGGKAVCLLLCGPEIIREYKARYGKQISLIASCMRGASVQREANLVVLCTTSLYGSALSQYSRVKVPTVLVPGTYEIKLNGSVADASVKTGAVTEIKPGVLVGQGSTDEYYYVSDTAGTQLANSKLAKGLALFPGSYTVKVNNSTAAVQIASGATAELKTGGLLAKGTTDEYYYVLDANGTQLANAKLNRALSLMPGTYTGE